jgi:hypothetical protein
MGYIVILSRGKHEETITHEAAPNSRLQLAAISGVLAQVQFLCRRTASNPGVLINAVKAATSYQGSTGKE